VLQRQAGGQGQQGEDGKNRPGEPASAVEGRGRIDRGFWHKRNG